jgi:hypothetical protein
MPSTNPTFLDTLRIASPCPKLWTDMELTGVDAVRFCGDCKKNVYDVSQMTGRDAELLIQRTESGRFELNLPFLSGQAQIDELGMPGEEDSGPSICLQLYRRKDGTVITDDCPNGLKVIRDSWRRLRQLAIAGVAMLFAPWGFNPVQAQNDTEIVKGRVSPAYNWNREANKHADIKALADKLSVLEAKPQPGDGDRLEICKLNLELARLGDKYNLLNFAHLHFAAAQRLAKTLPGQNKLLNQIEAELAKSSQKLNLSLIHI